MSEVMLPPVLLYILLGCLCVVLLSWAVVGIQNVILDYRRDKRETKRAIQNDEYHLERMKNLD